MKAQSTISGTGYAASPSFTAQGFIEDKLQGLSESELRQLHELVTGRLSKRYPSHTTVPHSVTDTMNLQQLTHRETEVLTLVASGYTRPEVATALKISRNTAATHIANIYRKLEIESIAEATILAFRCGVVK